MKKRIVVFAGNGCSIERNKYYYSMAFETGKLLALAGFVTVTGGGPGLMNEVLKGAYENNGDTIGVQLLREGIEQSEYITRKFKYEKLGPRQDKLLEMADGFIALPGGIGTFYEIFAVLSLKRKKEISQDIPLVIVDKYFRVFKRLVNFGVAEGFIMEEAYSLFDFVSSPEEAVKLLEKIKNGI